MATGPTTLHDLATALRDAALSAYDGLDVPGVTVPVPVGYVCGNLEPTGAVDTLAVCYQYTQPAVAGGVDRPAVVRGGMVTWSARFWIYVFRMLRDVLTGEGYEMTGAVPDTSAAEADALVLNVDRYVLPKAINLARRTGAFRDFSTAMAVYRVEALKANGGIGGSIFTLDLELS